jgi:chemotaxis signal transduction protein
MSSLAVPINETVQSARDVPGWLVLTIDDLELALPQCDVKSVELRSMLDVAVDGEAEAGWLEQDDKTWPVYGVNNRLSIMTRVPHSRRFCILLYVEDKYIGFLCDQVRILASDDDLDLQAMPECLISGHSPLKWITLLDKNVVAVVEKDGLTEYLKEMEAKYGTE